MIIQEFCEHEFSTNNEWEFSKMNTDLEGKIRNTKLPKTKPLCPLFEAISNSIDSIHEAERDDGIIQIMLERDKDMLPLEDKPDYYPIKNIKIKDNGIGFNEKNYNSFLTAESSYKIHLGAKGIGRFVWLKAFNIVNIESTFKENGYFIHRNFDFILKDDGIFSHKKEKTNDNDFSTVVYLKDIKKEYQEYCPRNLETIAYSIIDHFIVYFLLKECPDITLSDEYDSINLNSLYREGIEPKAVDVSFEIKEEKFGLFLIKLYNTYWLKHQIHLCADNREVKNFNLSNHISELYGKIDDERGSFLYQVYVISEFLNRNVNPERTDFVISNGEEESIFDEINEKELLAIVVEEVKKILGDYIHEVKKVKNNNIKEYVSHEAPEYRALLEFKPESLDDIPPNLPKDKLDIKLFEKQRQFEIENKEKRQEILSNELDEIEDLEKFKQKYERVVEEFNAIGKSQLAKYIVHRKSVLDLLEKYLSIKSDDTYWREDSVHKLVFPLRKTSDEIDFDKQNLWIIDERLSYHKYLASDIKLNKNKAIELDSDDRPDLIIFNGSFAFVNDDFPYESIVIIEFKRPGRDDYVDEDNPIDQVVKYIGEIRDGKAKDRNGSYIQIKKDNTPFYAYIICELTPRIKDLIDARDYIQTPDGYGYFYFHSKYNAYIEVISYKKLLKDSKERNRVLFDKLGILK